MVGRLDILDLLEEDSFIFLEIFFQVKAKSEWPKFTLMFEKEFIQAL